MHSADERGRTDVTEAITLTGVVHGQTVVLDRPVEFYDGEAVDVTLSRRPRYVTEDLPPGEGLRRSAGAWAADAEELDEFLKWNRQRRQLSRPEIQP
jgi:hypothetical protein